MQRIYFPSIVKLALASVFSLLLVSCNHTGSGSGTRSCAGNKFLMKYGCSLERVQREAEAGNADAQYALGYMYYYGMGTVQDRKTAMMWIRRSANQGQPLAKKALGMMSEGGSSSAAASGGSSSPVRRGGSTSMKQPAADVSELNQPKAGSVNDELPGYGKRKKAVLDTLKAKEPAPTQGHPKSDFDSPLSKKHGDRYKHLARKSDSQTPVKKSKDKSSRSRPAHQVTHLVKAPAHHESSQLPAKHAEGVRYFGPTVNNNTSQSQQPSLPGNQQATSATHGVSSAKVANPVPHQPKPPTKSVAATANTANTVKRNDGNDTANDVVNEPLSAIEHTQPPTVKASVSSSVGRDALSTAERELMRLPGSSFTLQLMGSHDLVAIRDFIRRHNVSNMDTKMYSAEYHGRPWYMLVYGNYSTLSQARLAMHKMPTDLQKLHPWIKSLHLVHKEIRLRKIVS